MFKKLSVLLSLLVLQPFYCVAQATTTQAEASNEFSLKLFKLSSKEASNSVVSPYSVSTALSMTCLGAKGQTKEEMKKTLGYSAMSDEQIETQNSSLSQSLSSVNPKSEMTIANALFGKDGVPFISDFVQKNEKSFSAKMQSLNFADAAAKDTINNWVKTQTKGKIASIIDQIPADAILYLVNAIYFKGSWQKQFEESATQKADFTLLDGSKKQVQMMNKYEKMRYLKGSDFQAVMLPYNDNRLQMCVFLPDQDVTVDALIASFTPLNWNTWMQRFYSKQGHLGLPKLKIEYKTELSKVLSSAGMPCAFDKGCADFSNMVDLSKRPDWRVFISRVLHKTYLEVNEKGTTAAAVTAVEMSVTAAAARPETPFEMVCDKPFLVAIRDEETGAILFLGKIVNP